MWIVKKLIHLRRNDGMPKTPCITVNNAEVYILYVKETLHRLEQERIKAARWIIRSAARRKARERERVGRWLVKEPRPRFASEIAAELGLCLSQSERAGQVAARKYIYTLERRRTYIYI